MAKIHYAQCDRANESDNNDRWGTTFCGLKETESELSDKIEHVNCKKCLSKYSKCGKHHFNGKSVYNGKDNGMPMAPRLKGVPPPIIIKTWKTKEE